MIFLLWIVNFVISWVNAWGCGKTWNESKHVGGVTHFMNWCGAIMSGCGFSWCYGVVFAFVGSIIPYDHDGTPGVLLSPHALEAFAALGYLAIIFPVLGTGLAITLHSWAVFWRRRTFTNGAVAGWNTFADVYNIAHAIKDVPDALRTVGSFFSSDSDDDDGGKGLIITLVAGALLLGFLTTYWILNATAKATAQERYLDAIRARETGTA